jgi:hypothetical protein
MVPMTSIAARRLPVRVARGWVLPVTLFVGCANKGESETPDEDASRSTTAMTAETAEAASDTAGTGPLPDECPLPPDVPCPATRLTRVPAGPGDGACVQSADCLPNAACIQQTCRPFDEIDVTICVHQTAFTGHTCEGANLVQGVVLVTPASGGADDGPYGVWYFQHWFTAAPSCATTFAEGEACVVAPLDRLIYDGVVASPIRRSSGIPVAIGVPADYITAYLPGHLGARAEILERLDAGCFDVPENNTVGHRSTVSIWGPQ